ncbi:hypothetical protein TWF730_010902 [Orbilia blumenaviensis]|uniref:Uncharacterized protein n=1 Tax=Orbilia blumenaviensis TaxID=1796055 RepID=A0AAV9UQ28_9PEZI
MLTLLLVVGLLHAATTVPQTTAAAAAATKTLFSTVRHTSTVVWSTCESVPYSLPLCENIIWDSFSTGAQSEGSISQTANQPTSKSSSEKSTTVTSTLSSDTSVPTTFRLRALIPGFDYAYVDITRNGPLIIDVDTENRFLQRDGKPGNNIISRMDSADFALMSDGTIRAVGTNQRIVVYRRQISSLGTLNDYGDVLILQEETAAENDISHDWRFSSCRLDLRNPSTSQIYRIYLRQVATGKYAVKMGALDAKVPSDFEKYDLCSEPPAPSSTVLTSSTPAPVSTSSIASTTSSSISRRPSSTLSDTSPGSLDSSFPSTSSEYSTSSSSSCPEPCLSSTLASSSSSSGTLNAYEVITLEALYGFCSDLLLSTNISTSLTVTSSSSATETSTSTFTSSELVVCTSSHIEYSSTSYVPTITTATNIRHKRDVLYTTPTPLTSFDDAEVRAGCASAITAPTTTITSTTTSVEVIPFLATTVYNSTATSYSTHVVSSTIQSVLTSTAVAPGYWKMRNDSLGYFDNHWFWVDPKDHTPSIPDTTIIAGTLKETFWQAIWDGANGGWRLTYDYWRISGGNNITDTYLLGYFTTPTYPTRVQSRWLGITKNANLIGPGKTLQYAYFDIVNGYATIRTSLEGSRDTLWTCQDSGTAGRPPVFWFYDSTGWPAFVETATDGPNGSNVYGLHDCVIVPGFYVLG